MRWITVSTVREWKGNASEAIRALVGFLEERAVNLKVATTLADYLRTLKPLTMEHLLLVRLSTGEPQGMVQAVLDQESPVLRTDRRTAQATVDAFADFCRQAREAQTRLAAEREQAKAVRA